MPSPEPPPFPSEAASARKVGVASVSPHTTQLPGAPALPTCYRLPLALIYSLVLCVSIVSTYGVAGDFGPHRSLRKPTPITPESWAFAIWLLILALQGFAVLDLLLPTSSSDNWKLNLMRTVGVPWQLGWICEVGNLFSSYTPSFFGLWMGLGCLIGAGYALVRVYSLRRRLALGPPAIHQYYLFFASTACNTAWLSFCLADGVLVICQTYGMPMHSLEVLAIVLLGAVNAAGVWVVSRKKSTDYGLTLIWVLVAVYSRQRGPHINLTALVLLAVTGLTTIFSVMRRDSACCTRERPLHAEEHKLLSSTSV
eukprot:CAMPEP_0177780082 /NCGR_PEP_ID=MMETSP0491_2-20121128/16994_1 /TAXON_ID=63592 /ORGANISM="Tetraselmis chuii, Strain PLY429" /LENGTH=310 /DNA_ID=CAMNT_0019299791 /DNA_START=226 /DNA_END=1158 /DNA_ORIENTATION=-